MPKFAELYEQVLKRLEGGGAALQADLADIEEGKRQAMASGEQRLVSGGLAGTTVMGAVPLAAEKTAGRARLRARGGAESRYTSAMISFANVAERSRQAELERIAAMNRTKVMIGGQARQQSAGIRSQEWMQQQGMRRPSMASQGLDIFGRPLAGGLAETQQQYAQFQMSQPGGGRAQQFPSLYNQGGQIGQGEALGSLGGGTGGGASIQMGDPIYGDPNVRGAGGEIIGTRQTNVPLGMQTEQDVTAGLPQAARPGGEGDLYSRMMTARGEWQSIMGGGDRFGPAATTAAGKWESLYKRYRAGGGGPLG